MTDRPPPDPFLDGHSATTTTTTPATTTTHSFGVLDTEGGPPRTPTTTSFADPFPYSDVDTDTLIANGRNFARTQFMSTPRELTTRTSRDSDAKEQKALLGNELAQSKVVRDHAFAASLYHHAASRKDIEAFLKETKVFDSAQERWKLPLSHDKLEESKMYTPLVNLLNAILEHFWKDTAKNLCKALSKAINTSLTNIYHIESVETDHYSRPDISIKAEGSSFQAPHMKTKKLVGYSNMASCIEVKIKNQQQPVEKVLLQLGVYARQIFIQQPNRDFVRLLLVTEQDFRLFHFDRSGVQYTEEIDLHSKATRHIFVRLVLGLCSPHESDLGLDTSIQWEIENERKARGSLAVCDDTGVVNYRLAAIHPIRSSFNIRGQCTTYWTVVDPESNETLLVKDSWRLEGRVPEREYLEEVRNLGLAGVARMVTCENERAETKYFRDLGTKSPLANFHNRISTRTLIDCEGKLILDFTSTMQLVCALYDAIAAHRDLSTRDILHRDVSTYNIALGKSGATLGNRGLLLGLDMAIRGKIKRRAGGDQGTIDDRAYWSIVMLLNADTDRARIIHPIAHDYLDDLEGFVYILGHILYEFDSEGKMVGRNAEIQKWNLQDAATVANSKESFLRRTKLSPQVEKHWPQSCRDLLVNFGDFMKQFSDQKTKLSHMPPNARIRVEALETILGKIDQYYDTVLQYFRKAIQDLLREENTGPLIPQTPAYSIVSSATHTPSASEPAAPQPAHGRRILQNYQSSLKRILEESPEDHPDAKREHYESPPSPTPQPRGRAPVRRSARLKG
ncbi:hypothetical protein MD484_g786, partial [Candolleomyces efflorescens]